MTYVVAIYSQMCLGEILAYLCLPQSAAVGAAFWEMGEILHDSFAYGRTLWFADIDYYRLQKDTSANMYLYLGV